MASKKQPIVSFDYWKRAHSEGTQARADLRSRLGELAGGCEQYIEDIRSRLATGYAQANATYGRPDVGREALYADPKYTKRVNNYGKSKCRMRARDARMEAEPQLRAANESKKEWRPKIKPERDDAKKKRADAAAAAKKKRADDAATKAANPKPKRGGGGRGKKQAAAPAAPRSNRAPASAPLSARSPGSQRGGPTSRGLISRLNAAGAEFVPIWKKLHPEISAWMTGRGIADPVEGIKAWLQASDAHMEKALDAMEETSPKTVHSQRAA